MSASSVSGRVPISPWRMITGLQRDPLNFLSALHRKHGTFVAVQCGPRPVYSIIEPEIVREVLVTQGSSFRKGRGLEMTKSVLGDGLLTSHGELHRRQRRLVAPAFQRARLEKDAEIIVSLSAAEFSRWRPSEVRDLASDVRRLSLAIINQVIFGASSCLGERAEAVREALTLAVDRFQVGLIPIMGLLERLPIPSNFRFRKAVARLDRILQGLIRERRQQPLGDDMLSLLLAQQEDGRGMSDQQLRDETMTLFLAGQETTASALAWALALLGHHPEWLGRARREVQQELAGQPARLVDLVRLPNLMAIWKETLRLFPPAWIIGRNTTESVTIAGEAMPARSVVVLPQWVAHRQAHYFPEPEAFRPQRWSDSAPPRFAYFPFGGGARICIGDQFAQAEGVLILATFLQNWTFQPLRAELPFPIPRIALLPREGLPVRLIR